MNTRHTIILSLLLASSHVSARIAVAQPGYAEDSPPSSKGSTQNAWTADSQCGFVPWGEPAWRIDCPDDIVRGQMGNQPSPEQVRQGIDGLKRVGAALSATLIALIVIVTIV